MTSINKQGMYGNFKVWVNERGIANLLSIPTLEEDGYIVTTHTNRKWVVISPEGEEVIFELDTGLCQGMPYIDLLKQQKGWAMMKSVEKVREDFDKITKTEMRRGLLMNTLFFSVWGAMVTVLGVS